MVAAAAAFDRGVYTRHFAEQFRTSGYYREGTESQDYRPAYQAAYERYLRNPGRSFQDVERDVKRNWALMRAGSRLAWDDARHAVSDGWAYLSAASAAAQDSE